ncbi:MAG: hypothetical protein RL670_50, partial [Actinomycetota bacterium]
MDSSKKPTLLLIDGHSLAFRAFYALSPDGFKTPDGQHTNAIHGFISMLLNLLTAEKPSHLAIAFDLSRVSFRTAEYPEYKGTRGETPPEFNGQTELLQKALDAMNIRWFTRDNYEADDIIASMADQAAAAGYAVNVISGDRDTFQLITEDITVLYPVKGVLNLARMNDEAVLEKYGVHAAQYPDLAALVGETSDNLPGIPGVGPKTAAKWLQEHGSLNGVLAAAESIGGKVGESLRMHQELAIRNRRLNHLVRDLPFDFGFDELALQPANVGEVKRVFGELAFRSLTERVIRLRGGGDVPAAVDAGDELDVVTPNPHPISDLPEGEVLTDATVAGWLAGHNDTVALTAEFDGFKPMRFGFSTETKRASWSPSGAAWPNEFTAWLKSAHPKAVIGLKHWFRAALASGFEVTGLDYDVLLMAYLLDPVRRGYELFDVAGEYLGTNPQAPDSSALIPERDLSLEAWLVANLAPRLHQQLQAQEQLSVYAEIELPNTLALAEMEHAGIQVNQPALEKLFETLGTEVENIAAECFKIIGKEINLASPKQLQTVLFEDLGMKGTKAVKTGFSTNAESLTTLFEQTEHPFLERLLAHREATKTRQMVEVILKSIGADGRIHTSYNQTVAATGRLSSENPNLQNIPIRGERGPEIRAAFEVSAGYETLLTADYSQIEMRIMAHLAGDDALIEAFRSGEDLHRFVGSRVFGVTPAEVTPDMRSKVKAMSYGLVYGLSEYGLAKQLRISNAEAKQLMNDYFSRFGSVKRYLATVVEQAKQDGYTTTVCGRRRPFDDLNSKIFQVRENARRAALNAP